MNSYFGGSNVIRPNIIQQLNDAHINYLKEYEKMESLELSYNDQITDIYIHGLSESIKLQNKLKHLILTEYNSITYDGMLHLKKFRNK